MGNPMALNLIRKKYKLNLYDLNSKLLKPFLKTNAKIINNIKNLNNNSNYFITMLPDEKAMENLVFKSNGILKKKKKNDNIKIKNQRKGTKDNPQVITPQARIQRRRGSGAASPR